MKILALSPLKNDPSRTVTLRRSFWAALRKRYNVVKALVKAEVVDNDAFGLGATNAFASNLSVRNAYWGHLTVEEQVDAFMVWLNGHVDNEIMSVDWHKGFIESAYKKGVVRAFLDSKKGKKFLQSTPFFEGSAQQFVEIAFGQTETISTLSVVFGQSYESLKNINASMAVQIRKTLADHLLRGSSIQEVSKALYDNIDTFSVKRARLFAQTEIIRAHAEGQLDSFSVLGVEEHGALAQGAKPWRDVCLK